MKTILFFLILCSLMLSGCGESFYFSESMKLDENVWKYEDSLSMKVAINDTSRVYDLLLNLVHGDDYPYQNVYLYVYTQFPSGKRYGKRLNLDIADKAGQWYGDCGGSKCEVQVDLQKSAYFEEAGEYIFTIKQYMRTDSLKGIREVGFHVREGGVREIPKS